MPWDGKKHYEGKGIGLSITNDWWSVARLDIQPQDSIEPGDEPKSNSIPTNNYKLGRKP
jgi:hypothetical protein